MLNSCLNCFNLGEAHFYPLEKIFIKTSKYFYPPWVARSRLSVFLEFARVLASRLHHFLERALGFGLT